MPESDIIHIFANRLLTNNFYPNLYPVDQWLKKNS